MLEIIADGKPSTPFMSFGDTIRIEMFDAQGNNVFGSIEQLIQRYRDRLKMNSTPSNPGPVTAVMGWVEKATSYQ